MYSLSRARYACSKLARLNSPYLPLRFSSPPQPRQKLCCIKQETHNTGLTYAVPWSPLPYGPVRPIMAMKRFELECSSQKSSAKVDFLLLS